LSINEHNNNNGVTSTNHFIKVVDILEETDAEVVLCGPREIQELEFYWNLGITSNNKE